jgi:hypothetical protein
MEEATMSWAEHKIEQYQHGRPATWLERRMLEHANPVHFAVAWVAMVGLVYGLWTHAWIWIVGSTVLACLGHVYCWTRKYRERQSETRHTESGTVNVPAR